MEKVSQAIAVLHNLNLAVKVDAACLKLAGLLIGLIEVRSTVWDCKGTDLASNCIILEGYPSNIVTHSEDLCA